MTRLWCRRPPLIGASAERVLHVLAGLLGLGFPLVDVALGLEALVVRRLAEALLGLAGEVLSSVLDLVVCTHDGLLRDCRAPGVGADSCSISRRRRPSGQGVDDGLP